MTFSVKRKSLVGFWAFILALSIVSRCNPTIIYQTDVIEYILLSGVGLIALMCNGYRIFTKKILVTDVFLLLTLPFFLVSQGSPKYVCFVCLCICFYYLIQNSYIEIKHIKYPILVFSIFTSLVTWISFFAPSFYISHILSMFPEDSLLTYSFLNRNMYHGFTNHYSRNSYYITIGIILLFSMILNEEKKSIYKHIAIGFLLCTELLVAKRGLTLFLILTMFWVYLKKEPSFAKKFGKSFKFIIAGLVLFVLAYMFLPGVDNIVNRIFTPNDSDDISSSRFYLWGVAIKLFINKPFLGNGWGSYLVAMTGSTFQGAHNDYLQFLAETGIVGFAINMILDISCLVYTGKVFDRLRSAGLTGTEEYQWIIFSYCVQVFVLLYALTGMPHYDYAQYGLYLMLCGYSIGLYKHKDEFRPCIGGK